MAKKTKTAPVVERSVRHQFDAAETADLHKRFRQSFADGIVAALEREKGKVD